MSSAEDVPNCKPAPLSPEIGQTQQLPGRVHIQTSPTSTEYTSATFAFSENSETLSVVAYSEISAAPSALRKGKYAAASENGATVLPPSRTPESVTKNIGRDTISDKSTMKLYDEYMTKAFTEYMRKTRRKERRQGRQKGVDGKYDASSSSGNEGNGSDEKSVFSFFSKCSKQSFRSRVTSALDEKDESSLLSDNCSPPNGATLCKYSTVSFMLGRWKKRHWAKIGSSTIAIFKTEGDFLLWLGSKDSKYVKKEFDFDTISVLKHAPLSSQNGSRVLKLRMEQVKTAKTRRKKETIYSFKLTQVTDAGTFAAVSFAASDIDNLLTARSAIIDCMETCTQKYIKKEAKKKKKQKKKDEKSVESEPSKTGKKKKDKHIGQQVELDDLSVHSNSESVVSDMSCIV